MSVLRFPNKRRHGIFYNISRTYVRAYRHDAVGGGVRPSLLSSYTTYNITVVRYYIIIGSGKYNNIRYWPHTAHARNSAPPINYTIYCYNTRRKHGARTAYYIIIIYNIIRIYCILLQYRVIYGAAFETTCASVSVYCTFLYYIHIYNMK